MAVADNKKSYYCEKCGRVKAGVNFYTSHNLQKYPNDGKLNQCKQCLTLMVDNWNPDTFLWIIEELDIPWVPEEWNKLLAKYAADPSKLTPLSILGKYISKMALKQYKDYRWRDTQFIQDLKDQKLESTMKLQGYDAQSISLAIQRSHYLSNEAPEKTDAIIQKENEWKGIAPEPEPDPSQLLINQELIDDLTEEDKTYLNITWGKSYRPDEQVQLENLYQQMMQSYDIQSAGDVNTLKLACKASLKSNQLLDLGDIDGAQKATKMYDALMKSGKWTAAQNKKQEEDVVDSIGEIVAMCEKEGYIPRFYADGPQDKIDKIILDTQKYVHDLVTEEVGLENLIQNAIANIQKEKAAISAAAEAPDEESEEDKIFDYDGPGPLQDQDYSDFKDFQESLSSWDELDGDE